MQVRAQMNRRCDGEGESRLSLSPSNLPHGANSGVVESNGPFKISKKTNEGTNATNNHAGL